MARKNGVVRIGTLTPLCNNFVSLLCGMLVFSCVFSVLIQDGYSTDRILEIIQDNGPANTGLTFIWYNPTLIDMLPVITVATGCLFFIVVLMVEGSFVPFSSFV